MESPKGDLCGDPVLQNGQGAGTRDQEITTSNLASSVRDRATILQEMKEVARVFATVEGLHEYSKVIHHWADRLAALPGSETEPESVPLSVLVVICDAVESATRDRIANTLMRLYGEYSQSTSHGKAVRAVLSRLIGHLVEGAQFEQLNDAAQAAFNVTLVRAEKAEAQLAALPGSDLRAWQPIEMCDVLTKPGADRKRVLVYGPEFGAQFGYVIDYGDGSRHHQAEGFHGDGWKITHWMPLPAPPSDD